MTLVKNSYARPAPLTFTESAKNAAEIKALQSYLHGNSQDMIQFGGEKCFEKNFYKCGGTEEVGGADSHNNYHNHNGVHSISTGGSQLEIQQDLRYSNQIGFKEGLLFPIAKTTNPPSQKKRRKSS